MIGMSTGQPDSKRYWFYARRSSGKQLESIHDQFGEFDKFETPEGAIRMPYLADTMSATRRKIDDRPEFNKLMAQMQEGDHLVVWRMDRLGRKFIEMLQTVEAIAEKKVWFHSLRESGGERLNLSSMEAKIFIQVLMIGHQMHVHYNKQNVARAREAQKSHGLAYTAVPKRARKRIQVLGPNGKSYNVDVWDVEELARFRYCWEKRQDGWTWHKIGTSIARLEKPWTYKYAGKLKLWVPIRPGNTMRPYRVDYLIKVVREYQRWLDAEILPGMKNDADKLTFGARLSPAGHLSVDVLERSVEPSLPVEPRQ